MSHMSQYLCGGQPASSTMWVLGIKLKLQVHFPIEPFCPHDGQVFKQYHHKRKFTLLPSLLVNDSGTLIIFKLQAIINIVCSNFIVMSSSNLSLSPITDMLCP